MTVKRLKCKVYNVGFAVIGLLRAVRRRTVTQTVWGDDICPVETDGQTKAEKKKMIVGASEHSKLLCYNWKERKMGGESSALSEG